MSEPFFSRWSQRKQALARGLQVDEPASAQPAQAIPPTSVKATVPVAQGPAASHPDPASATQGGDERPAPLPTLDDARALTPQSDFQPFMQPGVAQDVRNAAVKQLFADPHFNVMDGLDIYIGDYNTPDPMPAGMLQKMVGAQLLGLFDTSRQAPDQHGTGAAPVLPDVSPPDALSGNPEQSPAAQEGSPVVAKSPPSLSDSAGSASPVLQSLVNAPPDHDHPDLQLQPNHAPASPGTGPSTG